MPNFISKDGVQTPARERVAYTDKDGLPQIYEGPDRGALRYMEEQGLDPKKDTLGIHFTEDSQIIERAHDKNMTVERFTKQDIYTKEVREKGFKEAEKKIVTHALPKRSENKNKYKSGGDNTAGNSGHLKGGFGEDEDALSSATKSVK